MSATTIHGDMFVITIDGPRAEIRIWRRPDLDSAGGARNAAKIAEEATKLAGRGVRAVLLDVRDAPAVAGPKSYTSLSSMFSAWTTARLRVVILVSDDPIKVLQFKRMVTETGARDFRVMTDPGEGKAWLASMT
jgi:hypothetical protein